ncbi:MAG: response regulator, partial [Bdellovibrionales bacterium]|nr:response regulator [Bdellovibrionales bacterium]
TFWVLLPKDTKNISTEKPQQRNITQVRLDGVSALVIDDNKDTCEVLKQSLLSVGAIVQTGNSVQDGLLALQNSTPDIILTDLAMPGSSGLDLIQAVRNRSDAISSIPIIVLSACAFEADRTAVNEAGATSFIAKPFRPAEVIQQVRALTLASAMQQSISVGREDD